MPEYPEQTTQIFTRGQSILILSLTSLIASGIAMLMQEALKAVQLVIIDKIQVHVLVRIKLQNINLLERTGASTENHTSATFFIGFFKPFFPHSKRMSRSPQLHSRVVLAWLLQSTVALWLTCGRQVGVMIHSGPRGWYLLAMSGAENGM